MAWKRDSGCRRSSARAGFVAPPLARLLAARPAPLPARPLVRALAPLLAGSAALCALTAPAPNAWAAPHDVPDAATAASPLTAPAASPPLTPRSTGPELYAILCAPCHRADGSGGAADHAPSLINRTFLESASDAFLRTAIANGRAGTSMGAYGKAKGGPLDDAALSRLVSFLRSRGPAYHPPKEVVSGQASATRGAQLYEQQCRTCHGNVAVRGEAVHLADAGFMQSATDGFLKHAIVNGRPDTKMLAFSQTMKDAEIDDVVAYLRTMAKQPVPDARLPAPTGHEPMILNPHGKNPTFTVKDDRFVDVAQVHDALAAHRRMIIIDARPPSEWSQVHVTGAISIPYYQPQRLEQIPKDVTVLAYCACPHHLSGTVVDTLRSHGHALAFVLDEGINEWHRRGYPIVAAPGVKPPAAEPPAFRPPVAPPLGPPFAPPPAAPTAPAKPPH